MAGKRRWPWAVAGLLLTLVALAAWGEARGWPFLGAPAQRWLSQRLQRPVQLVDAEGRGFQLHLWGPIRLSVERLQIANADWSDMGPLLDAASLQLSLNWGDALAWRPGGSLHLQTLSARAVALQLQRLPDGRAGWALAPTAAAPAASAADPRTLADVLTVQRLAVDEGRIQLRDAALGLLLDGRFTQRADGPAQTGQPVQPGALSASVSGSYRGKPVRGSLQATSPSGWLADAQALDAGLPVTLALQAGRASLHFAGVASHLLKDAGVSGRYTVSGPSLAAVGEPLGITLPATRRFDMTGRLHREGPRWYTVVDRATVGSSRLGGEFLFERRPGQVPLLAGRLTGPALLLQDLGPAVGGATETEAKTVRAQGRVLPDRVFSLPALRAMDADVRVALDKLDFGSPQLQAAAPLGAHIQLQGGVLALEDLQATLAQGRISGHLRLDGRQSPARWDVDLKGRDLVIERWLLAAQRPGQPPWASGRLNGQITLQGQGASTAELLASADGRVRVHWRDGGISHLLVEAAGLDIAQGLGLLLVGDRLLPVDCGALDLRVVRGQATPEVMLVDTRDSLLWLDGGLSLATEALHLQAHVRPKDWSPLSLRTPAHIDGTLGAPALSLDKPQLLQRALPAALLAMLNPLAALLPLMDYGQDDGGPQAGSCRALVQRFSRAGFDAPQPAARATAVPAPRRRDTSAGSAPPAPPPAPPVAARSGR